MTGLLILLIAAELLVLAGLALSGIAARRATAREAGAQEPPGWPPVAVIVPIEGRTPAVEDGLASLLRQDYPDYEVIVVTRAPENPAVPPIGREAEGAADSRPPCRRVAAGTATACSQKNHNLLAGLRAADGRRTVFVFCDSGHTAPPGWLRRLVKPIADGTTSIATGYHRVIPGDERAPTLGRAATVLVLGLLQGIPACTQPWGGSTAVTRTLFHQLKIRDLWAENVVDDVSLATRLARAGIRAHRVAGAVLDTPMAGVSFTSWRLWVVRQWLYLKFCVPGTWLAGGLLAHLLAILTLAAIVECSVALLGIGAPAMTASAALFLLAVVAFALALRAFHPRPGSPARWLAACAAAIFMGSWCHAETWARRVVEWRGFRYRVSRGGRVTEVVPPSR